MPTTETISLLDIIWIPSGIAACAIFSWNERHSLHGTHFDDAVMFSFLLFCCFMLGPISLSWMLMALVITFFANR